MKHKILKLFIMLILIAIVTPTYYGTVISVAASENEDIEDMVFLKGDELKGVNSNINDAQNTSMVELDPETAKIVIEFLGTTYADCYHCGVHQYACSCVQYIELFREDDSFIEKLEADARNQYTKKIIDVAKYKGLKYLKITCTYTSNWGWCHANGLDCGDPISCSCAGRIKWSSYGYSSPQISSNLPLFLI